MPRKSKIVAVPVGQVDEAETPSATDEKTDAEKMTDIINEVEVHEPIAEEPKVKRASPKEKALVEPEINVSPTTD